MDAPTYTEAEDDARRLAARGPSLVGFLATAGVVVGLGWLLWHAGKLGAEVARVAAPAVGEGIGRGVVAAATGKG